MPDTPDLLWIDLETTGLDPHHGLLLEIAAKITDPDLNTIETFGLVVNQQILLNDLDPWILDTHLPNGLLREVVASKVSLAEADSQLANFIEDHYGEQKPILCGSSINFERRWLELHCILTFDRLHYRSIDVSSLKELFRRWAPEFAVDSKDSSTHRAMDDIVASIQELGHYRENASKMVPLYASATL